MLEAKLGVAYSVTVFKNRKQGGPPNGIVASYPVCCDFGAR